MDGQTFRNEIKLIADRLYSGGQTSGEVCPKCRGGSGGEKSLSVYREGGTISWQCHRNSCGYSGITGGVVSGPDAILDIPPSAVKYYPKVVQVPSTVLHLLEEKYRLTKEDVIRHGFMWSYMDGGRLAMPIKTRWMNEIGHSFRSLRGALPKNRILTYGGVGNQTMSWYVGQNEPEGVLYNPRLPVVVVEDQISAIRVTKFANAVSLLGTAMSNGKAMDIMKTKVGHVIIAFDKDAQAKAAKYVKQFNPFFEKLSMVQLDKDFKDCTDEEIRDTLRTVA